MKHSLKRLCGAGALVLPLSVWGAPIVEDLSAQPRSFYEQAEVREPGGGSLMLLNQLQENQQEIQQLRGQLEELRHQLEQIRQLNQERYLDLEQRITAGGAGAGSSSRVDQSAAQQVAASGGASAGGASRDAQVAYQQAFQQVQARDFPAAIAAFERFVEEHPDSNLTANGYYWLGELHSAESNLEQAAAAFQTVIDDYADSNKVPDALYKLGLMRARQGQPDASRALLTRVRDEFPDSNAAELANNFLNQSGV
ncbi:MULTISPECIES: tol-pal system protein YbgF [Halomonadaceae]|uniref:tol-pal system protein YbgF n=1 Tax=Halomonadaceae TaxID=28256 RepID=UPI0015981F32|nr:MULTISPECIES: tol-pal system protein YbgF [Halomonas]QJQ96659.1 tol-pal system protein YbgF [Halomonas sp. PA5]